MTEILESDVTVGDATLHVRSVPGDGPAILIAHGWPESSEAWVTLLELAAVEGGNVHAVDLPGVGASTRGSTTGAKHYIAARLADLARELGLANPTFVGHDAGGMVAYPILREQPVFEKVAILNTVVPGVAPWETVFGNPNAWHFRFHAIPELPSTLVDGNQRTYLDYFYDFLSSDKSPIDGAFRDKMAAAYGTRDALEAGFDWYRAMPDDAKHNAANTSPIDRPLLYIRGEDEPVQIDEYVDGFHDAGIRNVTTAIIPGSGHFPRWKHLRRSGAFSAISQRERHVRILFCVGPSAPVITVTNCETPGMDLDDSDSDSDSN